MIVVHVDRNAIDRNTREGRDDPAIAYHLTDRSETVHELAIYGQDGRRIGRLRSQSPASPTHRDRPLVWLELEDGVGIQAYRR